MRLIETQALLLDRHAIREYDLVLLFLTPELGIIRVTAFGANSASSTRGRICRPFQMLEIALQVKSINSTVEQYSLQSVEQQGECLLSTEQPTQQVARVAYASCCYLTECCLYLAGHIDNLASLFQLYYQTLKKLQKVFTAIEIERILRWFELQLLQLLGYDLTDVPSEMMTDKGYWYYSLEKGWQQMYSSTFGCLVADLCLQLDSVLQWQGSELLQLKKHNRQLLQQLLPNKTFKSREWLQKGGDFNLAGGI